MRIVWLALQDNLRNKENMIKKAFEISSISVALDDDVVLEEEYPIHNLLMLLWTALVERRSCAYLLFCPKFHDACPKLSLIVVRNLYVRK